MMEFFGSIQWLSFSPFLFIFLAAILPVREQFERLRKFFPRGDAALWRGLLLRRVLPYIAIGAAFFGLFISMTLTESIWSWAIGFTCLFVSGGLFSLFYVGPLYPLFDELSDAESRANKSVDSNSSKLGI